MTAEEIAAQSGGSGNGLLGFLGQTIQSIAQGYGSGLAGKSVSGRTEANNFTNPANPATGAAGQPGVVPAASASVMSQALPYIILAGIGVAVAFLVSLVIRK